MSRKLVLIHGRAQQEKDAVELKAKWLEALDGGLAKSGLRLPIVDSDVRFPYYGDTLVQLAAGVPAGKAAQIVVRGEPILDDEFRFLEAVVAEVQERAGITDAQVAEVADLKVIEKGQLNQPWVLAVLRAVDRFVPGGSGAGILVATNDVYHYLRNENVRAEIEEGVRAALTPGVETIIVAHSLGSVIAYNMLRTQGERNNWQVPLLVTVGSPLAVTAIRKAVQASAVLRCPPCVTRWVNALDTRDIVALYPLTPDRFPLRPAAPAIDNHAAVRNKTNNHHGIDGYLDDERVVREIYQVLTA